MKKITITLITILLIATGLVIYRNQSSKHMLSEDEASKIAIESIAADKETTQLNSDCISATAYEKDLSVIRFTVNELETMECNGNKSPGTYITRVFVNLKTGEVFDAPIEFSPDQEWSTVQIEGKDYQFIKKLR
jgi:hypothetical protein